MITYLSIGVSKIFRLAKVMFGFNIPKIHDKNFFTGYGYLPGCPESLCKKNTISDWNTFSKTCWWSKLINLSNSNKRWMRVRLCEGVSCWQMLVLCFQHNRWSVGKGRCQRRRRAVPEHKHKHKQNDRQTLVSWRPDEFPS